MPPPQCFEYKIDQTALTYALCAEKGRYRYGEAIRASFTLTNTGNRKVTLNGGDKPALELQLAHETWTDIYPTPATQITIEAGAAYTIEGRWIPEQAYLEDAFQQEWANINLMTIYTYETQIQLEPGETYSIEWQWPTAHTNLATVLTHQKLPGENVARIILVADYALQPNNRWSFVGEISYALEDEQ
jgi:hypothetical protein